ncbi:MAG TPA: DUF2950 family protein [Terriglobales bacterium]|nr:DUF2950 family protein [Terriglobales bacterium]
MSLKKSYRQHFCCLLFCLLLLTLTACKKEDKTAAPAATAAETFASPDEAGAALLQAAKSGDAANVLAIFGSAAKDLVYSGDPAEDKAAFTGFVSDYQQMHRWRALEGGNQLLITGSDNKVFPIPLVKEANGRWSFDASAGKEEILARRIGRNELASMDIITAIAVAQMEYFAQKHDGTAQFTQKFISDEGTQDGLYWPSVEGKPRSPIGPLVAFASAEGLKIKPDSHQPFHGYFYRLLDAQGAGAKGGAKKYSVNGKMTGGFAVVAYPASYGDSGIATFMMSQQGVLYEKDLGKTTNEIASAMTEFNPDKSWKVVR